MPYSEIRIWGSYGGDWWSPDAESVSIPESYGFLDSGDGGLTRRVKKLSRQAKKLVYLKYVKHRMYNTLEGIYAPKILIKQALEREPSEAELAIRKEKARVAKERRQRRDIEKAAIQIRRLYPSMPEGLETQIAEHAWQIGSGRVGRVSCLERDPHELAVVAYVRHNLTEYDDLLDDGHDREEARNRIRGSLSEILRQWEQAGVVVN